MTDFKSVSLNFLKGLIIALLFSLVAVLVFAGVIQICSVPLKAIKPITVIIKIIAVAVGTLTSVKGEKGLLKGAILGALIILISFIVFSIIGSGFTFNISLLWELLLGVAVGGISGIFSVNLKK